MTISYKFCRLVTESQFRYSDFLEISAPNHNLYLPAHRLQLSGTQIRTISGSIQAPFFKTLLLNSNLLCLCSLLTLHNALGLRVFYALYKIGLLLLLRERLAVATRLVFILVGVCRIASMGGSSNQTTNMFT